MKTQASILVIDDEPDNFDVIETLLHGADYQLHYAPSGQRAIQSLPSFQPDVILLDVMMPDLDGIQVCQQIKANPQWQAVPIIMITALTAKEDLARCLAAGADDFISKPVNGLELRARVHSMLRIKQQYDSVQTLLQLREDMVNMLVHDLRNPLASILISTHILKLPGFPIDKQPEKIEHIAIAAAQMETMIDSLLIMAKLESGKLMFNYTEVDLCALCSSALSNAEAIAAQKHLNLIGDLPEPGGMIQVDATILRRVLDNLLSNAIKFSPSHSQVRLRAEYLPTGDAQIHIADSGPGVRADLQQQIFEKYEVGTLIQNVSQIGLGLAFCKMAIDAHQGTITVTDNHPQGTIFTVVLRHQPALRVDSHLTTHSSLYSQSN
ncbi:hybrid sensor histidine kinase/response regulator [Pantanalinema sp. GBBB05]|uniref:hybrid sensor histidine kinase/response regulator n=1 Tax=Pantanalinema sp. GBBB05 TaxID=2604139 RepID=UPI001D821CB0|nr:response regulator [Pantanalinema sp. GBBB05]